jgi:2OG-Fe(II) oxygenase superfamily
MQAATATKQSFLPAIGDRLLAFDPVELSQAFKNASPFPHIVLDLDLDPKLMFEFPNVDWLHWDRYGDGHQKGKRICSELSHIPTALKCVIEELHSSEVLTWLESLSGVGALIPDPHLEGGGLHASEAGGILRTHTDFHSYRRLDVSRRLNLLVYLNDAWSSADGGALQLHRKGSETPAVEVVPTFGRVVIFETSDRSPHGFMNPIAEGKTRQSVALYYYTAKRTEGFDGDANTYWLGTDHQGHRIRQGLAKGFQTISRAAAVASHMADTNRGVRDLVDRRRNLRKP